MRSTKLSVVLLPVLMIMPGPLYGQDPMVNPATVIMQKVVQKMKDNEVQKQKHLNFKKHFTDTKLDDSNKPKKKMADQIIDVRPPLGSEVLIQEDGEPRNQKRESGGEFDKIIEALSQRFEYEMAKPTADCPTCPLILKDGKAYMIINFKGNENQNAGDDIKKIMNRSAGKMYVDIENLYVQRFESYMTRTYSRAWGIFQLKQADLVLEQKEVDTPEGKIIVVATISIKYRYYLFGESRGIRAWEYQDYRYVP